jgi:hypothetical protein
MNSISTSEKVNVITADNEKFYTILPVGDSVWICQINDGEIRHLAKAPSQIDAHYFVSPSDPQFFACLDQACKRIALYRYLNVEPWFEKIISPSTLPRNCHADDVLIHDGLLYVGGRGRMGECLWTRDKEDKNWRLIPMPSNIRLSSDLFSRHKSIDLVFWDGTRLIAVDNFVIPKWILTYDISDNKAITHLESIKLSVHTTYERVITGAMNHNYMALLSGGINHGNISRYLSILDVSTLTEIVSWCLFIQDDFDDMPSNQSITVINVAFLGDYLLLATLEGVLCAKLNKIEDLIDTLKSGQFDNIELRKIVKPQRFVTHPSLNDTLFVIGIDVNEQLNYERVDMLHIRFDENKKPIPLLSCNDPLINGYGSDFNI